MSAHLIDVERVVVEYPVRSGPLRTRRVRAVDGVDLHLGRGEILGLVGESGCGKSTLARTVVGLREPSSGRIVVDGVPAPVRRPPQLRRRIQMVYQDPGASLDPRRTVMQTLREPLRRHRIVPPEQTERRALELLELVGLGRRQLHVLPRELSGGQRQRVAIARALAVEPAVLVADEAVAALDASVAGAVLNLLHELRDRLDLAVLFISHDLAAVRGLCDRVAVMYLGAIVEEGPTAATFARPGHPYTRALLDAVPRMHDRRDAAVVVRGEPPSPLEVPAGCRFHPRCPRAMALCGTAVPPAIDMDGAVAACHLAWNIDRSFDIVERVSETAPQSHRG
ncbi:oligopeptide/dipeptide ABC transporter ATP-binding protein [Conexibacter woesei]|uniref:Oligopeptide/dipeptide ABC transporter, ATPase subunit n=1 Tax=Conexibacter woesei (strain DSM 14684 / CCUG 47730 / CIP 108061 / JCM 11494 / NBRC 100937 / ID131577) TaxID=469383 RepID=D3F5I8_CONWI|nr:ABC transporter ATP-binding protein [Conexibacter woesei]ADB50655.1 oligopeptide/dipeptide ABC transporter, ATPase subunit [Conexibacter woesei DSM 14684]